MSEADVRDRSTPAALIAALRPRQWLKNVLVFAAPLAAGALLEPDVLRARPSSPSWRSA